MAFPPWHEFNTSYRLQTSKMQDNAKWLLANLLKRGYSFNASVGMIANFDHECTLNPNDPQASTFPEPRSDGKYYAFGFPQWDRPSGKGWYDRIGRWGRDHGIYPDRTNDNPLADGDLQLDYLQADAGEEVYGRYWYQSTNSEGKKWWLKWDEFKKSDRSPDDLARIFYWSYERSSGGATSADQRASKAKNWYEYLKGEPVPGKIPIWLLFKFRGRGLK